MRRCLVAVLAALWCGSVHAGDITGALDLQAARDAGLVPAWVDPGDKWWAVSRKELLTFYVYDCFVDAQSSNRWVIRSSRIKRRQAIEGERPWNYALTTRPLTLAEIRVCFPGYMPPPTNLTFTPNP